MTEELRLVLLAAGILIIAFIAWDATRQKKRLKPDPSSTNQDKPLKDIVADVELDPIDKNLDFEQFADRSDNEKDAAGNVVDKSVEQQQRLEPSFSDDVATKSFHSEVKKTENNDQIFSKAADDIHASSNVETLQKPKAVITLNLMAADDAPFQGNPLLQELLTLGFKYGEMDIFHRYQHANGQGERWFCLANAFNPGKFDLDNMADFNTLGLTLFMLLPGPQDPLAAFDNMLNAADKLSTVLGGRLEDGSHSALSQQRIQMYQEEIKYFLRKQQMEIDHFND